jgi:hypothetical protein
MSMTTTPNAPTINIKGRQSKAAGLTVVDMLGKYYHVESGTTPGRWYKVDLQSFSCNCEHGRHRGGRADACCHVLAALSRHFEDSTGRRLSFWLSHEDAERQHRPVHEFGKFFATSRLVSPDTVIGTIRIDTPYTRPAGNSYEWFRVSVFDNTFNCTQFGRGETYWARRYNDDSWLLCNLGAGRVELLNTEIMTESVYTVRSHETHGLLRPDDKTAESLDWLAFVTWAY